MFYYLALKSYLNYHTKIQYRVCFFVASLCYFILITNYKSYYYSLIIPIDLAYVGLVVSRDIKMRYLILGENDPIANLHSGKAHEPYITNTLKSQELSNIKLKKEYLDKEKDKVGHNVVDKIIPGEIGKLNLSHLLDLGDTRVTNQKILKKLSSLNILETEDSISSKLPKIKYKPHKIQLSSPLQQTVRNLGI